MTTDCWINGEPGDSIPVADRGLHYGDGLFETLAVKSGHIGLLDYHMERLHEGCRRLHLRLPAESVLRTELMSAASCPATAVLKLIVTRGTAGRGYQFTGDLQVNRILTRYAWPDYPAEFSNQGIHLRICDTHLGHNKRLAGIKHLNRLEQVLARAEWSEIDQIQEGLMLDEEGSVIEGTMSNVFAWLDHGVLATPDLRLCGVAGVMRRHLLEMAKQAGVALRVASLALTELMQAQEIFVCNSLIGVWPVASIGHWKYSIGSMTRQAQRWAAET
ncbi:MAG TPA: aminodeoxychorismate lyase [Gammaproteobacteria bacterium]|nr:aminodeoxychorismate lyase [Gammaproteobacteria bacterium]